MYMGKLDKSGSKRLSPSRYTGTIDKAACDPELTLWLREERGPDVMDYHHAQDCLLLVWDDTQGAVSPPRISIVADFIDSDIVHVLLDGVAKAEIKGDPYLSAEDVTLMPLSAAMVIGLAPC